MDATEQEILKLDAGGMATREIAVALKLSEREVEAILLARRSPSVSLTDQERETLKLAADEEVAAIRRAMFRLLRKRGMIPDEPDDATSEGRHPIPPPEKPDASPLPISPASPPRRSLGRFEDVFKDQDEQVKGKD